MKSYELYESNNGALNLAILDDSGNCVYFLSDLDRDLVLSSLDAFKSGSDPITDCWEGGEENPQECYKQILGFVEARNGGARPVDA